MNRFPALALVAMLTGVAVAGTTVSVVHNTAVFRPEGGTTVTIHDKDGKTALEQCMDMAKAAPGKSTCTDVYGITATGTCDDVAKSTIPRTKDADGFTVQPPVRYKESTTGDLTDIEIQDYVPAPYPACWVLGWRDAQVADLAPPTADLPNSIEPFPFSAEDQLDWDARQVAAVAACAAGDVKQCPPGPPSLDTPCGRQFCGVGADGS